MVALFNRMGKILLFWNKVIIPCAKKRKRPAGTFTFRAMVLYNAPRSGGKTALLSLILRQQNYYTLKDGKREWKIRNYKLGTGVY